MQTHSGHLPFPQEQTQHKLASVCDRLLGFVLDVLLFVPLCSLILAQVFRRIEYFFQVSPSSTEFYVLLGVGAVLSLILLIIYQALAIMLWEKTPGQFFLKLKIVNHQFPERRLSSTQALLRSFLMVLQTLFIFPWLEVLSHPLRRALHDRASDTTVVTLKAYGDLGPHPLESAIVRQVLFVAAAVFSMWSITSVGFVYRMALHGDFKKNELIRDQYLCDSVTDHVDHGESRIDKAVALYLADQISSECLQAEADFIFWQPDSGKQDWAYFAKSILYRGEESKSEKYLQKACEISKESEVCKISKQMQTSNVKGPFESLSGKMIWLESLYSKSDFAAAERAAHELSAIDGLQGKALEKIMKMAWLKEDFGHARGILEAASGFVDSESRAEMAAWLCFEELQNGCHSRQPACDKLKEDFEQQRRETNSVVVGLTLVKLQSCRPEMEISPAVLQGLRDEKENFRQLEFVQHNPKSSNGVTVDEIYKKIAVGSEKSPFLRYFAALEWMSTVKDGNSLEKFFEKMELRHFNAYQSFRLITVAAEKALEMNFSALGLKIALKMPEAFWQRDDYKNLLALAYLATGEKEKAKIALNAQTTARGPASISKIELLKRELRQLKYKTEAEK
jgi:uncharacterized RDD family membrane protein YckC